MQRSRVGARMVARPRRWLPALLATALLVGVSAPASAWRSYLADDQGTLRGDGVGPEVPGVAWLAELEGLEFHGGHGMGGVPGYYAPIALTNEALALVIAADTTNDAVDDVLVAVDTADGTERWRANNIEASCGVAVADDGRLWAMRDADPVEIVSIDAVTGVVRSEYTDPDSTEGDRALTSCNEAPLRLSVDQTQLFQFHRTFGSESGDWLRVYDLTSDLIERTAIVRLVPTGPHGSYGDGWYEEMRVAPAGSPAEGTLYLFESGRGATDNCCGDDDVNFIHAIDPTDLPATSYVTDPGVIERSRELPVERLWTGAIVVLGDRLFLSAEEGLENRFPADGGGVDGRNFRVKDDGSTLTVEQRSVGKRSSADRREGDHNWHYDLLTAGDGSTLTGGYRAGAPAGMDAQTLQQTWSLDQHNCPANGVAADADGTLYFRDFCDEVIGAVGTDGRVRWLMPDDQPQPFIDGPGQARFDHYEGLAPKAVTDDGKVILVGSTSSSATYQGIGMIALDLGTATERAAGTNRLETAVDISQEVFPGGADTVVIAKAGDYPDALAGAPLAVAERGPLLLSATGELSDVTAAEVDRLGASRAILLGGEAALSAAVASALTDDGLTVERIAGTNRFDTARLVKNRLGTDQAVIVEGFNADPARGWPDAVAASGWAASTGRAILLVSRDRLPADTQTALGGVTDAVIVGGTGAVSADVQSQVDAVAGAVSRVFGVNRYETSVKVAERSLADGNDLDVLWLATGTGFADALTAGPATALTDGVLMLINGRSADGSPDVYDFLRDHADEVGAVRLVGGTSAISDEVAAAVQAALGR